MIQLLYSPYALIAFTLFLLYYQIVLGRILSFFLRLLVKGKILRLNKKINLEDKSARISFKLKSCRIRSVSLSSFAGIAIGDEQKNRTFLLTLALKHIEFKCSSHVTFEDEESEGIEVDANITFSLDAIRVNLFSFGLLLMGLRKLQKMMQIMRGEEVNASRAADGKDDVRAVSSNESEMSIMSDLETVGHNSSRRTPLYMLKKIIGRVEVMGLKVGTSAHFSCRQEFGQEEEHELKWSFRSNRIMATMKALKENGQAGVSVQIGGIKSRLKTVTSSEPRSTHHDLDYHSIQAKSVEMSMGMHFNDIGQTAVSIQVDKMEGMEGNMLELVVSSHQLTLLSNVVSEWVKPLLEFANKYRENHRPQQQTVIQLQKSKLPSFLLDQVDVKLGANAIFRDGRLDSLVPTLRLSTDIVLSVNPSSSGCTDELPLAQLSLLHTRIKQTSEHDADQVLDDLFILDEFNFVRSQRNVASTTETDEQDHDELVISTSLSFGAIKFYMNDAENTERIVAMILSSQVAITGLLPQKSKLRNEGESMGRVERDRHPQDLSVSCRSCEVNVAAFCQLLDGSRNHRSPIHACVNMTSLTICVSSNADEKQDLEINACRIEARLKFTPHPSLPTYITCTNELLGVHESMSFRNDEAMVEFVALVSNYYMIMSKSLSGVSIEEQNTVLQLMEMKASDLSLKEYMHSSDVETAFKMNEIVKIDGFVQVTIKDTSDGGAILQIIDIQTLGPNLSALWSPVFQWLLTSAIKRVEEVVRLNLPQQRNRIINRPLDTKKKTRKVFIISNNTSIHVRAILGGSSVADIVTRDVHIGVTNDPTDTWSKPTILFESGRTTLNLNEMDFNVAILESMRYFNGIRRATGSEVRSYCEQRSDPIELEDEIEVGFCGTALVEIVQIDAKECVTIDFPPELHLGKVIEDINITLRTMKDGLKKSKLVQSKHAKKRKYQLMDISLVIPVLDVHFLESQLQQKAVSRRSTRFGEPGKCSTFVDIWRFIIKGFDVKIKRHTPPALVQDQLHEMDEDKSREYLYGPMIQGGHFHITFDRVINTLHPLNLATPLGDITNWQITGLIYLTSLSPDMSNLVDGENYCVPMKCHHSNSMAFETSAIPCRCDYAMNLYSTNIPVKIYYDLNITSDQVHSTFGHILMPSIPRLMRVIDRLIPKPPIIDPRDDAEEVRPPPLDWWDNLRYQFHGKFKWKMERMSFRWLLDTVPYYDWSILLTSQNFALSHSIGTAALVMEGVIISIPDSSYHMLDALPLHSGYKVLHKQIENSNSGFSRKRHPLILFPKFRTVYNFEWGVSQEDRNHSSRHHNVYMTDNLVIPPPGNDKFKYFRSKGWSIVWNFELDGSSEYGTWIALRGDVLPWITHRSTRLSQNSQDDDGPDALPRINGIKIDADVSTLNISAWFDEKTGDELNSDIEESQEGIFLQVPKFSYSRSRDSGQCFDLFGPVKAALLDIYRDYGNHSGSPGELVRSDHLMEWSQQHHHRSFYEINAAHSLCMFESLEMSAKQIVSLDYLLEIAQVKILDQSLEDIRGEIPKGPEESGIQGDLLHPFMEAASDPHADAAKKMVPWTVLVAGMKLLWTVDIRDSVISIVKDVLFAINFMTVNLRGTPQLLDADAEHECSVEDTGDVNDETTDFVEMEESDHSAVEIVVGETVEEAHIMPVIFNIDRDSKPKSALDYLLRHSHNAESSIASPLRSPSVESYRDSLRHIIESFNGSTNSAVPTFDLHLSNPQIQFHSAKTGGSVIIGIRGAYIEGKKFIHLLAKNEDYEKDDFRLESLFRRTEFLYTLDRMELFCVSNTVDIDAGLQWLSLSDDHASRDYQRQRIPSRDWDFPPELDMFSTKEFTIPVSGQAILQPIMDPSTFKTRQEFHRPPIDLTKEELEIVIEQKHVKPLEIKRNNALDSLEFFVDELSFHLNSYQFSTTLDVVRNTLLEPHKPREERYYQKSADQYSRQNDTKSLTGEEQFKEELIAQTKRRKAEANTLASEMQRLLKDPNRNSKKWKETARRIANELVAEVDDSKKANNEPSTRRIEYNLCKAKWKIAATDDVSINDAEVNFTDFKGVHDFSSDGQSFSHISLEDMYVICHHPSADAMNFPDPTIIVKTILGEKRSPCQRCGNDFDRNFNEVNSCRFHPGTFRDYSSDNSIRWSCCGAGRADSTGCVGRPHTGSEKAMDIRFDAYPRMVEGLTLYKFIELNVYPGATHKTVVQLTRSSTKSFMNYFLGETNEVMHIDATTLQETLDTEISSKGSNASVDYKVQSQATPSAAVNKIDGYTPESKRYLLFGESPSKREIDRSVKSSTSQIEKRKSDRQENKSSQTAELVFLQNWNLGAINLNVSLAGFHRVIDIYDLPLVVSEFQRRYKIGPIQQMVKKYVVHLIKNLGRSGMGILKVKLTGNKHLQQPGIPQIQDGDFNPIGEDTKDEEEACDILLAEPKQVQKKKSKFGWRKKKKKR